VDDDELGRWAGVITTYVKDLLGSQYDTSAVVAEVRFARPCRRLSPQLFSAYVNINICQEVSVLLKQQYSGYLVKCQNLLNGASSSSSFLLLNSYSYSHHRKSLCDEGDGGDDNVN
jgi:hypothetical protein